MSIKVGTTDIAAVGKIKLGTSNITKVYQGTNQIFPSSVGFSANMTVGKNGSSTIYGYDSGTPYGSLTNNTMVINGLTTTLVALLYNINTSSLVLYLNNLSTTSAPIQWSYITIGGTVYNRTDFAQDNVTGTSWRFLLNTATNPIGTTVGATKTITIT
jgi:hypothetical protein